MKKIAIVLLILAQLIVLPRHAYALSVRHHIYNMGRSLVRVVVAPLEATFIKGPKQIKSKYHYEVWGLEQPEKRGRFRNHLFAIWRAPGDQAKAMIDGVVESVGAVGTFSKEFISIFFSD